MKCFTCTHFHYRMQDQSSPYGEQACLKLEVDLFGTESVDVENCPDYKEKEVVHK